MADESPSRKRRRCAVTARNTFDLNADPPVDDDTDGSGSDDVPLSLVPLKPPAATSSSSKIRLSAYPSSNRRATVCTQAYCNNDVVVCRGVAVSIGGVPALQAALATAKQHVMNPANISAGIGGWWNKEGKAHYPLQFTYGDMGSIDPTDRMYGTMKRYAELPPAIANLRFELAAVLLKQVAGVVDIAEWMAEADNCTVTQYVRGTQVNPCHEPGHFKPFLASIIAVGDGSSGRTVQVGTRTSFVLFPGDVYVVKKHAYERMKHCAARTFSQSQPSLSAYLSSASTPPASDVMLEFKFRKWKRELKLAASNGVLQWPPPSAKSVRRQQSS